MPTWKELGFDVVVANWRPVIGPRGMGRAKIAYWEAALAAAVATPEWQQDLARNFWSPNFTTGAAARQYVEEQGRLYREIFSELGMARR